MTEQNVNRERYCLRADTSVGDWAKPDLSRKCAECGTPVIYNPTHGEGPVRLVCIDCLHRGRQS